MIASLAAASGIILLCWGILTLLFAGVGLGLLWLSGLRVRRPMHWLLSPWLGLAATLLYLQVWHLFRPIDGWALSGYALAGVSGWIAARPKLPRVRWMPVVLFLIAALWLSNRAIGPCFFGDTGLYHLTAMRWAREYAIVPGLVNLHGRLAFNNSSFLVHAMLEVGPGVGRSFHVVNGMLLMWGTALAFYGASLLCTDQQRRARAGGMFLLMMSPIIVRYAVAADITGLSTDLPATMITLVASSQLLSLLIRDGRHERVNDFRLLAVMCLLAAAVTVKLSVLFYAALAMPIALIAWARRGGARSGWLHRSTVVACVGSAALLGVWVLRGYILSGYPMYPSTIGGIALPWAASHDQLVAERDNIVQFARTIHSNRELGLNGWQWVKPWLIQVILLRSFAETLLPAVIAGVSAAIFLVGSRRGVPRAVLWMLCAHLLAIGAWLLTAPSPRMGTHVWWGLAGLLAGMAVLARRSYGIQRNCRVLIACVAIVALLPAAHQTLLVLRYRNDPILLYYGVSPWSALINEPGSDHGLHPLPPASFETRRTDSGLVVHTGIQWQPMWDPPLPATPEFNPKLRLRNAATMQDGFVLTE